jgi:hypothetical protein
MFKEMDGDGWCVIVTNPTRNDGSSCSHGWCNDGQSELKEMAATIRIGNDGLVSLIISN